MPTIRMVRKVPTKNKKQKMNPKLYPEEYSSGRILVMGGRVDQKDVDEWKGFGALKLLANAGWNFVAKGKIEKDLIQIGIKLSDFGVQPDGFPVNLGGGGVPNLRILSGILADPDNNDDTGILFDNYIEPINIVFLNIRASSNVSYCCDNPEIADIDVCLFSYFLAAIRNSNLVTIITDPADCGWVANEINLKGVISMHGREILLKKALCTLYEHFKFLSDLVGFRVRTGQPVF